ncbi:GTPase IMAP family member 4-like [Babylonia areolata]|uniref:GTPase IMAP family member 4-like n=1 Tax=Babylonia areolata TaxID=304850 RepID=UPI003FD64864
MDSPGLGHTDKEDWVICNMLAKSVALADPGPNVIIFAIRHHSGYSETFKKIKQLFSNEVKKYLIIVFIGMDEVGDKNASIEDRRKRLCEDISKSDNLQQMVGEASGGFFGMNNKTQREKQAQDLIKIMQNLVRQNKGECYKSDMTEQIRCSVEELVRSKLETNE